MHSKTLGALVATLVATLAATLAPHAAQAQTTYASTVLNLLRGTAPGDFAPPQFYGGSYPGSFPVALTDAQARAAVLGAPDGNFLSLPGPALGESGSAFQGAYVDLGFGADFDSNHVITLHELGNNGESAHLFIWTNNGGNLQLDVTRGASDDITVDLRPYAGVLTSIGATAWRSVAIGGIDDLGASRGFDLDSVSITAVPEPSTTALLLGGLGVLGWAARRTRRA